MQHILSVMTGQNENFTLLARNTQTAILKGNDATRVDRPVEDMHLNNPNSKPYQPSPKPSSMGASSMLKKYVCQSVATCQQRHYTHKCPMLACQTVEKVLDKRHFTIIVSQLAMQ